MSQPDEGPVRKYIFCGQVKRYGPFQLPTNIKEFRRGRQDTRVEVSTPQKRAKFVAEVKVNEFRRLMLPRKLERNCKYKIYT